MLPSGIPESRSDIDYLFSIDASSRRSFPWWSKEDSAAVKSAAFNSNPVERDTQLLLNACIHIKTIKVASSSSERIRQWEIRRMEIL